MFDVLVFVIAVLIGHVLQMIVKKNTIMVVSVGLVGLVAIIGLTLANLNDGNSKNLEMVQIVMRHGIRTPASTYPKDPYINYTFYPTGWGQLTNAGKLLQYNTGKYLRERYGDFLGVNYYPDEFYVQSTDVDRTKASLQLTNAGIWPPSPIQEWGPLDWQPIPIHAEPLEQDSLLLVRLPCPQFHIELERVKKLPEIQKLLENYKPLFQELEEVTGAIVKDFDGVQDIFTTLVAEKTFNLTLPDWTKALFPDKMEYPSGFSYVLPSYTDKLRRLKGGPLLKKILQDFKDKKKGKKGPRTVLYGGHDFTIANLLGALKVLEPHVPDYGVAIFLELHKNTQTNEYSVEIFYRNSTTEAPKQLTIPGCSPICPLDKILELTKPVIPENWKEECATDDDNFTVPPPNGP